MTKTRLEILRETDAFLRANPEPKEPTVRIRYRGQRPAWNWLKKHDEQGAAALWIVARERLPQADNDNLPTEAGPHVDRRDDGHPRGRNPDPRSLEAYLALPAVKPRLGDAERKHTGQWWRDRTDAYSEQPRIAVKPQRDVFDFHTECRFGFLAPAIAEGAIFLGAIGGLGQPKVGKRRGDVRLVDAPDIARPPADIDTVIEVMLAGGNVADVGKALGARGGYADRRGGAALRAAGRWATAAVAANDNLRRGMKVA